MSVVIESKRTRGIGGPFAVVVNARHGRSRQTSTISPFPERTVRCLAEIGRGRFQVVYGRNHAGGSVEVQSQIRCLWPPERFMCLRRALVVVAKLEPGGFETRSAIELVGY